jgi:hypothetical protein
MGEQLLFNTIVEFFEEDEWDFQWMEGMSVLTMGFSGTNGKWQCYAQARELQKQFVFYSVLPINVPEDKRAKIAEFITRINYGMIIGNFEMDYDDGEVRYKTSIDVEGAELNTPMIRQVVYANLIITDRYLNGLMRVMYSDLTAEAAIDEIDEEALDIDEELEEFFSDDFGDDDDDFDDDDDDDDDLTYPPPPNGSSPYSLN